MESTLPAPTAAFTASTALTLDTQPGTVPTPVVATQAQAGADPEHGSGKKGKKAKKEKAPTVNYFSLYRCRSAQLCWA